VATAVAESSSGAKKMRKCRLWWKQSAAAAAAGGEVASTAAPALLWFSLGDRAGPLGAAKPTILPGVGVAVAARGSCGYRGWCIYLFF
jgi:hypothetical protein